MADDTDAACILFPTVNLNCEWDACDPATHQRLLSLPSWNNSGTNHVVLVIRDAGPVFDPPHPLLRPTL
eukprot:2261980-Prymnesium_polylepis.1